jgi:lipoprotein-anchoring transpeptidase ErfK/SrfK
MNTNVFKALKIVKKNWLYPTVLLGVGCLVVAYIAFFALTNPALASILNNINTPVPTQENLWAIVDIAKPTLTPIDVRVFAPQLIEAPTNSLSDVPTAIPTDTPVLVATEVPTVIPETTETPGVMTIEIVDDDSVIPVVPPDEAQKPYPAAGNGEGWIDVNLSEQRVYAYEGDVVVNSFIVSTGVAQTPTVTGEYRIWIKVRVQDMSGPGYYLRDVPYVMFFYEDYALHGTYWHNNFGTPMSRGCVNLRVDDAAWLFNWASVGTVVNVHY